MENITRLGVAAHAVSAWPEDSGLRLNVGKTKAIIFGCDYNIRYCKDLQLPGIGMTNGVHMPFVDTITNLGVVMDSKVSWKSHIEHVKSRVNRALYGLKIFRACTTEALRK